MLLAGRKLTAVEARDCGLVTDVFPHDKFTEEVQNRVQAMAKLPPQVENCIVAFHNRGLSTMESLAFADMLFKGG